MTIRASPPRHRRPARPPRRFAWLVAALVLLLPAGAASAVEAAAPTPLAALEPGGSATVAEIVDGDTLVLADGRQVRLVGIQTPKLPLGRPDFPAWPLAEAARTALAELALGREAGLAIGGAALDRHGRTLAHLHVDGTWLQGALLARGLARVYSFSDNRALAAEMLALEAAAREAGRGIWADPWYRVLPAAELAADPARWRDSFQIVEGEVVDVAVVRNRAYLNFGDDWRSDFTVVLDPAALKLFAAAGRPLESLEGRRIRVRGWIKSFNGPMIDATHPEQIEELAQ